MSALVERLRSKAAPLLERLDAMTLRERILVLVTVLVLAGAAWQQLLMQPLALRAEQSRSELEALHERIADANRNLEEQVLQLAGQGSAERARIATLRQRIDEINATLGDYAAELVDPAEMAEVLEGVLREQSRMRLVRIRNLSPEALSAGEEGATTTFYRHGLEIEVEGSYFALLDYLSEVEALPWRLYWQLLELEVQEYPTNRIRLQVSTLSLDEEWIGG